MRLIRCSATIRALARVLVPVLGLSLGASAQSGRFVPDDAVTVVPVQRQLLAVISGRGQVAEQLQSDEELLWSGARGLVGLALTTRRALAISPASGGWQALRQRISESDFGTPQLGAEVALVETRWRVLAFDGRRGRWAHYDLGPNETLQGRAVDTAMAVAVTSRHVLGLRAGSGRIESERLTVHETVESVRADGAVGVVTTSRRLLVHDGVWSDRPLPLR